jgi:UDP-N-acetylglucosamine--N-acetylmuramyl-(pentapeptide) pyrophosphoryl-undecaprenol N-acetylglucosamine transferase
VSVRPCSVVIAGGGTGGHVFPMLAIGDALRRREPSLRVVYVGTARGIEAKVIPARGDTLELLDIRPLRGGGARGFVEGVAFAAASLPAARRLVGALAPLAALSLGGYAGGPVALAARSLGVPVTLMEPNSVLGLSNRLLAPLVERAYTAFAEAEAGLRPSTVRRFGVPLRSAFEPAPYARAAGEPLSVLVFGGSQGARAFNEVLPEAFARVAGAGVALRIVHQTGHSAVAQVKSRYLSLGLEAEVTAFIDDMASALSRAHLVVSRSGASSLGEITAIGRPAIFIPFPFAADDHQYRNAKALEDAGAAVALRQSDATASRLAAELLRLATQPGLLEAMARASGSRGEPQAAQRIADDLLTVARRRAPDTEEARCSAAG